MNCFLSASLEKISGYTHLFKINKLAITKNQQNHLTVKILKNVFNCSIFLFYPRLGTHC